MRVTRHIAVEVPNLGNLIRQARESDKRSLRKICKAANMSPTNWYRIEREDQELPETTLRTIEKVLNVSFNVTFPENLGESRND